MPGARFVTQHMMAALAVSCLASGALGQDVEMGRNIALEYCSACHDVEPEGKFKQAPPSFAAIAVYRSPDQIRARIVEPIHEDMPEYLNYMIGGNIDDMVAYIASLEQ